MFHLFTTPRDEKILINSSQISFVCPSKKGVTIYLVDGNFFDCSMTFDNIVILLCDTLKK